MSSAQETLAVVMPVYNEEACIAGVIEKWNSKLSVLKTDFYIHAYNDGSRDHTSEVLHSVAERLGERIIIHDKANGGHGQTILTGYLENCDCCDWIFQIDSDDEMGPEKFDELWKKRESYDFLVGIRDGRRQPLPRKLISLVSRISVRCFFGKSIWDVNTPYRLMRCSAFAAIFKMIPLTTFAPNVIISGMMGRRKLRYFEIPVPQKDRQTGEVSIKKLKLLKAAARSFAQTILFALTRTSSKK